MKLYYTLMMIGIVVAIIALVAFLLPIDTNSNSKSSRLQQSISYWEYTSPVAVFTKSIYKLRWSSTPFTLKDFQHKIIDKSTKPFDYRIDGYQPTYLDTFHVYDYQDNRFTEAQEAHDKFTFVDANIPPPREWVSSSCIWYDYHPNGNLESTAKPLLNQPSCNGISGFKFKPMKFTVENLSSDCESFDRASCQRLCQERGGYYKRIGD